MAIEPSSISIEYSYDPEVLRERWTFIGINWTRYLAPYFRSGIHHENVDQFINLPAEPDMVSGCKFMINAEKMIRPDTLKNLLVWLLFHFLSSYEFMPSRLRETLMRKADILKHNNLFVGHMIGLHQEKQTSFEDLVREHQTWFGSIETEAV